MVEVVRKDFRTTVVNAILHDHLDRLCQLLTAFEQLFHRAHLFSWVQSTAGA